MGLMLMVVMLFFRFVMGINVLFKFVSEWICGDVWKICVDLLKMILWFGLLKLNVFVLMCIRCGL